MLKLFGSLFERLIGFKLDKLIQTEMRCIDLELF